MAEALDLDAIREKWLNVCPSCDAGLPSQCTHPDEDYRATMLALVDEVERLWAWGTWARNEIAFWKDQQRFAASAAATIADLDEEAPALRQLLRGEKERRRRAEDELDKLRAEELTRADAVVALDDDLPTAADVEIRNCAWDLVRAADKMRDDWAETTDSDQRNRELWTPLHCAADTLRDRLEVADG